MTRLFCLALVAIPLSGCALPGSTATTGWSFSVGKPSTALTPAVLSQMPAAYATQGLGAGPLTAPKAALPFAMAGDCGPGGSGGGGGPAFAAAAPRSDCTLDDVCRRLDSLERKINAATVKELLPMPRGQANE